MVEQAITISDGNVNDAARYRARSGPHFHEHEAAVAVDGDRSRIEVEDRSLLLTEFRVATHDFELVYFRRRRVNSHLNNGHAIWTAHLRVAIIRDWRCYRVGRRYHDR